MIFKHFRCRHCLEVSTAGEWNSATLKNATNRCKKGFAKIQYAGTSLRWYICPKCGRRSDNSDIEGVLNSDLDKNGHI